MKDNNNAERRRYFRINDTVKLSYRVTHQPNMQTLDDTFDLIAEQDRRMEILIAEQKHQHPEMIELIALLNQKIERLCQVDKNSKTTLAHHARNVNISACGLAFTEQEPIAVGTQLQLFLILEDDKKLELEGLVIDCQALISNEHLKEKTINNNDTHYNWRVDFLHLNSNSQELLIQHIVRRQSTLLAEQRA